MAEEDSTEKSFDPTPQKLEQAREKGEVPHAQDLTTAAATAGLILALVAAGPFAADRLGGLGAQMIDTSDRLAPLISQGARGGSSGLLAGVLAGTAAVFLVPLLAALSAIITQRALVFAPEKLMPKLSRISPVQGAKSKFGANGLFTFAKSFVKLVAVGSVLFLFLATRLDKIIGTAALDPGGATRVLAQLVVEFLLLVLVLQAVVGFADLLWQRFDHQRKNRMSRKELMDELKTSEGDPALKAERRQRAMSIATNRMLTDVPTADVVIVNPTHFAVALKWDRKAGRVPVCVAKGVDEIAFRIRERAAASGVPVRHDPVTARTLHATVEIGQEIAPEHYRAVAAAIRFAEAARKRARSGAPNGTESR